jgi:dCMP deaminase
MMLHSFTWDEYFMTMTYLISMKSKDPSTKVGAVIVGPNKEIRSTGYNGLPRTIADRPYRYENRKYKHFAINHAEENAILNCALVGVSTMGCTLYCPWLPCANCAKFIIQSGIAEVVYDKNFPGNIEPHDEKWKESIEISRELLLEAGVIMREFEGSLIQVSGLYQGVKFDLFDDEL